MLEPMGPEHASLWLGWRCEAESVRFNPLDSADVAALEVRLAASGSDLTRRDLVEYRWLVVLGEEPIGTVSARINWRMGWAEIGYQIGARWHGKGLGKRAVVMLVGRLLAETELERLVATISADNEASVRIVRGLGFVEEGRLRGQWILEGRRVDVLVFGLLRGEWRGG